DHIGEDYSKKEIQELAGIRKASFFAHWPKAEELRLTKVTRTFGNTKVYTLNRQSPLVKDMLKFEARIIEETSPRKQTAIAR
ncbi:MAG: hypothetical protein Q7R47_06235, partial [Candidatus Diapherotrites archaeon]|nr:hypothetical protein [Candidatus Diapherotrites archaeon]